MTNTRKELLSYLENVSLFLLGAAFFAFPLLYTTITTDAFVLPKQLLLAGITGLSILILGIRMIAEGKVRLRTTPFDLPVFLFFASIILSTLFAVNRYDALISAVPLLFAVLLYFVMINVIRGEKGILFTVATLVLGTTLANILSLLSFFKIYVLPFAYAKTQTFSTFGSLFDQAIFTALVLPIAGYLAWPVLRPILSNRKDRADIFGSKSKTSVLNLFFTVTFALLIVGLIISAYMLVTLQKPMILPFTTGFQTAFAAISQDAGRYLQGFLFGSGYGTYLTDFTRFKQAAFNTNADLWSFTFFRSSSFVLELLATTGVAGLASFLFLVVRVLREKSFFLPLVLAIIAAFILPFSFTIQALFFIILGFFAALRALHAPSRFSDLEFYFVALKHGLILAQPEGERAPHDRVNTRYGHILPFALTFVVILLIGAVEFFVVQYAVANATFQRSYAAIAKNDARTALVTQASAIQRFPYEDLYHLEFSQLNLRIANALASSTPKGASPSAEVQQGIVESIQRSINSGRSAVTIAPQSALNWNNLSSIYRSLIGFGDRAEEFAILTNQQAVQLDPSNPQQYIALGGIYYQLGMWDDAIRQFQVATNLKGDYANAYYNLGHALENKGDLQNALRAYQAVAQLVADNKENSKAIKAEIDALQKKIASGQTNQQANNQTGDQNAQDNLSVDQPNAQLPERDDKVEVPPPPATNVTPTPTRGTTGTPTPAATE